MNMIVVNTIIITKKYFDIKGKFCSVGLKKFILSGGRYVLCTDYSMAHILKGGLALFLDLNVD